MAQPIATFTHSDAASEWANSPERAVIFTVERPNPDYVEWQKQDAHAEGDEGPAKTVTRDYTMPAKPNVGFALQYLREARRNADTALAWLLETAIGDEGYDALVEELSGVTGEEAQRILQEVSERIQKVAMGGLDAPKG